MMTYEVGLQAAKPHPLAQLLADPRRWVLLAMFACSYVYFIDQPSWNQSSRFALTRAVVDHGTLDIDADHIITGDKSYKDGHFYCDKAPGVSALAMPGYWVYSRARELAGLPAIRVTPVERHANSPPKLDKPGRDRSLGGVALMAKDPAYQSALYIARSSALAPLAVAGLIAFAALALHISGGRLELSLWATALYGLATPAFPYATALYGHRPYADCLVIAFACVILPSSRPVRTAWAWLAGSCLGLAVCSEYPAAPSAALLWALAFHTRNWRFAGHMALAGLPWALALAWYHTAAFGQPLATGYDFVYLEHFAEGMREAYGIGWPKAEVLGQLLFGRYRGLFYVAPITILAAWGCTRLARPPAGRVNRAEQWSTPVRLTWAWLLCYPFILNASYYMWDGGAAFGPRHCMPALPFLCLGLVPALRKAPRLTTVVGCVSLASMLLAAAARPEAPTFGDPLWDYALPKVLDGRSTAAETSLGHVLGLPGGLSLLPLLVLWGLGLTAIDLRRIWHEPDSSSH